MSILLGFLTAVQGRRYLQGAEIDQNHLYYQKVYPTKTGDDSKTCNPKTSQQLAVLCLWQ